MQLSSFDKRQVHKVDPWAVLVTGVAGDSATGDPLAVGADRRVGFTLPLGVAHPVYAQQSATVLGLEAFRQAGTALAHVAGNVPLDHRFIATRIALAWSVDLADLVGDLRGEFDFRTLTAEHRRGVLVRHTFEAAVRVEGRQVAVASGDLQCVDPRVHARLRSGVPTWDQVERRYDPAALRDVRTTADELTACLGWNADDRMVFDHGVDHVPAMHLARSALTAHHLMTADATAPSLDIRCARYVELSSPTSVRTRRTPEGTATEYLQDGLVAATVRCAQPAPVIASLQVAAQTVVAIATATLVTAALAPTS